MTPARVLCYLTHVAFMHHTAASPVSVFRPTGGTVTLEFQGHQQVEKKSVDYVMWYCGKDKIMKYVPPRDTVIVFTLKDRVEFNKETFSLELKNLQKNDSGLYRGEISARKAEVKVEYKLSVLDPVESPVLSVVSNWTSCDSCYVTCKGHDLSLTSECNRSTCSPEGGASTDSTLTLSFRSGIVICNYSNLVSWSNYTKDIKLLCCTEQSVTRYGTIIAVATVAVAAIFAISLFAVYCWRRVQSGVRGTQTEYGTVEQTQGQSEAAVSQERLGLEAEEPGNVPPNEPCSCHAPPDSTHPPQSHSQFPDCLIMNTCHSLHHST